MKKFALFTHPATSSSLQSSCPLDNTHLREKGARMVCELLVKELAKNSITSKILKK